MERRTHRLPKTPTTITRSNRWDKEHKRQNLAEPFKGQKYPAGFHPHSSPYMLGGSEKENLRNIEVTALWRTRTCQYKLGVEVLQHPATPCQGPSLQNWACAATLFMSHLLLESLCQTRVLFVWNLGTNPNSPLSALGLRTRIFLFESYHLVSTGTSKISPQIKA